MYCWRPRDAARQPATMGELTMPAPNNRQIERRFVPLKQVEVRAKDDAGDSKRVIGGHAAVAGPSSDDLGGFIEIIAAGALGDALTRSDARCLFNHNPDNILGRMSAGTLRAEEDEVGLAYENDMPNSSIASTVYEAIQRGDVTGNSFAFYVEDDRWENRDGVIVRTILKFEEILDMGPVTYPAYSDTTVSARSLEKAAELRNVPTPEQHRAAEEARKAVAVELDLLELEIDEATI